MVSMGLNAEALYNIGFRNVARWRQHDMLLSYEIKPGHEDKIKPILDVNNALYAFCRGDDVLYIGKTTQSLRRRMTGYCKPGKTQATNLRCNGKIRSELGRGQEISILAFTPTNQLQFGGFEINLAAGLEDSLIRLFAPPWNGGNRGVIITESAEIEAAQDTGTSVAINQPSDNEIGVFSIRLGDTYYNQGIVNPGIEASRLLGEENETLVVRFGDGAPSVATRIDRRANRSGAVRFVGGNQVFADWFQRHFQIGDIVTARILGPNEVELLLPHDHLAGTTAR